MMQPRLDQWLCGKTPIPSAPTTLQITTSAPRLKPGRLFPLQHDAAAEIVDQQIWCASASPSSPRHSPHAYGRERLPAPVGRRQAANHDHTVGRALWLLLVQHWLRTPTSVGNQLTLICPSDSQSRTSSRKIISLESSKSNRCP